MTILGDLINLLDIAKDQGYNGCLLITDEGLVLGSSGIKKDIEDAVSVAAADMIPNMKPPTNGMGQFQDLLIRYKQVKIALRRIDLLKQTILIALFIPKEKRHYIRTLNRMAKNTQQIVGKNNLS